MALEPINCRPQGRRAAFCTFRPATGAAKCDGRACERRLTKGLASAVPRVILLKIILTQTIEAEITVITPLQKTRAAKSPAENKPSK